MCGESWIHSKENQSYIEKILYEDLKLKNEYGKVESYKIVKVGRYFGSGSDDDPAYDSYTLKIEGEKNLVIYALDFIKIRTIKYISMKSDSSFLNFLKLTQ